MKYSTLVNNLNIYTEGLSDEVVCAASLQLILSRMKFDLKDEGQEQAFLFFVKLLTELMKDIDNSKSTDKADVFADNCLAVTTLLAKQENGVVYTLAVISAVYCDCIQQVLELLEKAPKCEDITLVQQLAYNTYVRVQELGSHLIGSINEGS